ncbi:pyruvate kinase [Alloprevotella sp. OH1205_COT-284]|uniref:pyruvate kinase n=1 Tax=Alloprevotella sp. OH1205_COT-284 TaxID=2491043 RepID=UPI000F5F3D7F|nr:pyruvate kinase [Alloprevotella sp. OH1205_COT-284]RRD79786.1 pyruvate kinase [Alloprevotella sp. OH1205_COT-284]
MYKKTKIVATISDKRCDVELLQKLYDAGMNVVRLNTAHQDHEGMKRVIDNVRAVSEDIGILVDTKGPEVRTTVCQEPINFVKGTTVHVVGDPDRITTQECIAVTYPHFVHDLRVGSHILIDDGALGLIVYGKEEEHLVCTVENDAVLNSRKSVNVPGVRINLPSLTPKDRDNIIFAVENNLDFIAHSFVRSKEDVRDVREILSERGSNIRIIAKIENQEGVDNIDEIIEMADGIMVARGDLGIEVPEQFIPGIQRRLIDKCIRAHKPVIVATQMLQSMITNPRPTRTEVTDIANAVYSHTDALMLSGETAYGEYPVKAVEVMANIAWQAEKDLIANGGKIDIPLPEQPSITEFFAKEAVQATQLMNLRAIILDSLTGRSARFVSSYRSKNTVLALCNRDETVRHLALSYGVYAMHMPEESTGHEFLQVALRYLLEKRIITHEDRIVFLGSHRKEQSTSFMELDEVSDLLELEQ